MKVRVVLQVGGVDVGSILPSVDVDVVVVVADDGDWA